MFAYEPCSSEFRWTWWWLYWESVSIWRRDRRVYIRYRRNLINIFWNSDCWLSCDEARVTRNGFRLDGHILSSPSMNEQQVYSKGVSNHSTSHPRYTQDTLSMEYVPRNYSSSPLSSSPLPHTPFASSSPPGYPRVQRSPDIVGNKSVHGYPEDYDDISASWGTDHQRYIAPMKSLYSSSGMSVHTSRTSQRTFNYDASYASEGPSHLPRPVSPIETDEEEFPDIRQTCFAISSERGRWKSSPIPIKTH